MYPQFRGIQLLVVTHRYNSTTLQLLHEPCALRNTTQAALLLNTTRIHLGSQLHQCVGGNTVHLATWSECTRISLPAKPSITRARLGQLCSMGRVSGGTASTANAVP
jgi:hypothetical protein